MIRITLPIGDDPESMGCLNWENAITTTDIPSGAIELLEQLSDGEFIASEIDDMVPVDVDEFTPISTCAKWCEMAYRYSVYNAIANGASEYDAIDIGIDAQNAMVRLFTNNEPIMISTNGSEWRDAFDN